MQNTNIVLLILLFAINSYSYSWLNSVTTHVDNYYNKNSKPQSLSDIKFKVESDKNSVADLIFKNNTNYAPNANQKIIGNKGNFKKIDVFIDGKWYPYGELIDKGNWRYLFKYHPANYDSNGNLNFKQPFSKDFDSQCIESGNALNVGLDLSINGAFYPVFQDDINSNTVILNRIMCYCNDKECTMTQNGKSAQLYVDKPNSLHFTNQAQTITENLLERVGTNNQSAGVTIKGILTVNKQMPGLNKQLPPSNILKIDPKNCLNTYNDGVNCKFDVIYTPQNKSLFYSGYIYVYYNTKRNPSINMFAIPININNNPAEVQGKIISGINDGAQVQEDSRNSVTFQFTNTSNKTITNIKLKDEVPHFVSQESSCPSKLLPNDSCKVTVVFKPNRIGKNIISTIFSYNKGFSVDLSLSVNAVAKKTK